MKINPATETNCATIEFSKEDERKIDMMAKQFYANATLDKPVEMQTYSANREEGGMFFTYSVSKPFEIKTIPVSTEGLKIGMDRPSFDVPDSSPDYQELWFDLYELLLGKNEKYAVALMEEMDSSLLED